MKFRGCLCFVGAAGLVVWAAAAAADSPASEPRTNAPPIRQIGQGVFEVGAVRLDRRARTVRFPAVINMTEGLIEYALVGSDGKIHESLLRTETEPYHIHLAMLLLGARTAPPNTNTQPAALAGDSISIHVRWKNKGAERAVPLEDLIRHRDTGKPLARGPWIYNGSRIAEGAFVAQRDRSVITIIDDPDALVNNPRPDRENDELWYPRSSRLPPMETSVEVIFGLGATNSIR